MPRRSANPNRFEDGSLEFLESTAEASFVSDEKNRIVVWNQAATTLLGFEARQVLGRPCHRIVRGTDLSGNRFCSWTCAVRQMARRHEAIHAFPIQVTGASGSLVTVRCTVVVVTGSRPGASGFLHLLLPATRDHESENDERSSHGSAAPGAAANPGAGTRISPGCPRALTLRETQVLRLMAAGTGTRQVASLLSISPVTVRNHIAHILDKLEVHNKLHAIVVAHRLDLI
jgi:PAS domain S-box-containing protein